MPFTSFITSFFASPEIRSLFSNMFGLLTSTRATSILYSLCLVGLGFYVVRKIFGG